MADEKDQETEAAEAQPEEVAHGTLNFCLPASQYVTGAILPVDGGLLIKNA